MVGKRIKNLILNIIKNNDLQNQNHQVHTLII